MGAFRLMLFMFAAAALAGCASRPINEPITQADPKSGYRPYSKDRPYIHLVDGGVADNLGVRPVLETLEELAVSMAFRKEVGSAGIRRIVLIVVNARSAPKTDWDRSETPPGIAAQLLQASSVPIDRYSFETIETMKDRQQVYAWRR